MPRTSLASSCLVALAIACSGPASLPTSRSAPTSTPASAITATAAPAPVTTVAFGPDGCPVTPAYLSDPADPAPENFPAPTWLRNAERTLWVGLAPPYRGKWWAGLEQKARWWRRGPLSLEGRRLDGPAPPLVAQGEGRNLTGPLPAPDAAMPTPAAGGGQSSGILIPEPGCWEIVARTPWDELRFVVYAYPLDYAPAGSPFTDDDGGTTLAAKASAADAIVLVEMEGSEPFLGAFLRQRTRARQVWKGEIATGAQLTVLQDQGGSTLAPPLLQAGRQYLLFLERRPGDLWRVRDEYTYGVVEAGAVRPARPVPNASFWQWQGETLAEADALLRGVVP